MRDSISNPRELKVFLCHGSEDKKIVREIYARLREYGVKPWLDEKDILPGQDWDSEIKRAVRSSDAILVCLSQVSVKKYGYLQKEIRFALDVAEEKLDDTIFIIPVRLSECEIPERLGRWQWVNYFEEDGYARLVDALRRLAGECGMSFGRETVINSELPDQDSELGVATSVVIRATPSPYGTKGFDRRYLDGSIYLISEKGDPPASWPEIKNNTAFKVKDSLIGRRYESLCGTGSKLGFPLSDEDGAWHYARQGHTFHGRVQWFEGGKIYGTEWFGAHAILEGAISEKFMAYERWWAERHPDFKMTGGILGFPISEQLEIISRSGKEGIVQRFMNGCIISWEQGTYAVHLGLYELYQSIEEWQSGLGFPLSDEEEFVSGSGRSGATQKFESGCIQWDNQRDCAFYVYGEIYRVWDERRQEMGFALNSMYVTDKGRQQDFEGGRIEYPK